MKSLQKVSINRANAILMIVDVENEFCKPGGKLFNPTKARIAPGMISAIRDLAGRVREAGVPVVYIQSVRTLKEPEFTVFGVEPHLQIGTWGSEIVEELKPRETDTVVQKFSHDPFFRTKLDAALEKLVPDPTRCYAVVTGGAINVCLYHATMGLYLRNYWTVVLDDCVFYSEDWCKQVALQQFSAPAYPNIFLSRSDLVEVARDAVWVRPALVPGT